MHVTSTLSSDLNFQKFWCKFLMLGKSRLPLKSRVWEYLKIHQIRNRKVVGKEEKEQLAQEAQPLCGL